MERVTLSEALAAGDLEPFIRQAEADGVGPADADAFAADLARLVKEPPQEDQTSH
jgi:hypothetical protein